MLNKPKRFDVQVLGCKVNQYEAEQIKQLLGMHGWKADARQPELIIIHSCAVTAEAVSKVRKKIRRATQSGARRTIVTGCCAAPGLVDSLFDDVTFIAPGQGWLERLESIISEEPLVARDNGDLLLEGFSTHHRAFLKIQDGCDIGCSYCIVPSLRGPSRDKPLDAILKEARQLVNSGYREIVVTGVSVGLYGKSGGASLATVLHHLNGIEGLERIRMSSLHPGELTEALLSVWQSSKKIMPHIHLPLQSGSDDVLTRMRRGYTGEAYLEAVRRARKVLNNPSFNTDIIIGFPGETDRAFRDTVDLCNEVGFSRIHLFPYSVRPGTAAENLSGHIPPNVIKDRMVQLSKLGRELAGRYAKSLVGRQVEVLVEKRDQKTGLCEGYSEQYMPVVFESEAGEGVIARVNIKRVSSGERLIGISED